MDFLIILAIMLVVAAVVSAPLRREWNGNPFRRSEDSETESELAELEAARDAKYREIRDAELDHRTGKLSEADFEALDSSLRAEAVEILHQLDQVKDRQTATIAN